MKFKEIKKLSHDDLQKRLNESRVKLRELRFSVANNQLKRVREIRNLKMIIAQILTVLNSGVTNSSSTSKKSDLVKTNESETVAADKKVVAKVK